MSGCGKRDDLVPNAPAIEVDPLALDFGPVPLGLPANLALQIKNISRRELKLNALRSRGTRIWFQLGEQSKVSPVCSHAIGLHESVRGGDYTLSGGRVGRQAGRGRKTAAAGRDSAA